MTRRPLALTLALTFAGSLGGCGELDDSPRVRAPAVEVAGEAVDCLQASNIRSTRVHDDYTIDFAMTGGRIYRNTLPQRCPGLGFEERFAYELRTGRLCRVDTIKVLRPDGLRGPACGLGAFVPVRYAETDAGA